MQANADATRDSVQTFRRANVRILARHETRSPHDMGIAPQRPGPFHVNGSRASRTSVKQSKKRIRSGWRAQPEKMPRWSHCRHS